VVLDDRVITGELADGHTFSTYMPNDLGLARRLIEWNVRVVARQPGEDLPPLLRTALDCLPFLAFCGVM
jgi:cell division protease FtsH